ncbi:hypothetical protein [Neptunomonas japonica]|uniref:Uncharacterized protein n=1 Tax=Neptunomonas japonica JAMM 1380 TaxID=1441457 RepID=A0A7R6PQI6_9GAMM|nr:hypothetical protein [Neptunomonas japonica]BBB30762.1 conserved hypothetical protein [Neptunomonas japonica JAMM 1380]
MITLHSNPLVSSPAKTDQAKAEDVTPVSNTDASIAKETESQSAQPEFSSRAEMLAQMNKEFDITGTDFHISQQFINRLSEIGLLSKSEATELNQGLPLTSDGSKSTQSLTTLKSALDNIFERVKDEGGASGLLSVIDKSRKILDNLDGSKSKTFPIDPATAAAELDHYLKSDDSSILAEDEKQSLNDLKTALTIADKLSPEQRTSAQVSKYMEILKRYG